MAATRNPEEQMECGYCFEKGGNLSGPKILPCSHVYCTPCITKHMETTKVLQCGICRKSYDTTVDELPSINAPSVICAPCKRKGQTKDAVIYCHDCDITLCGKHQESHDDLHEHKMINITKFNKKAQKLKTRYCTTHSSQPVTLACTVCNSVLCSLCLDGRKKCEGGVPHQSVSLTVLVEKVMDEIEEVKLEAQNRVGELSSLIKMCSQVTSKLDEETKQLVELLHTTRDTQINAIREKYNNMEAKLVNLRTRTKNSVGQFTESVSNTLRDLTAEMQRLEARARDGHQVDIVNGFTKAGKVLEQLVGELPSLTLDNPPSLDTSDVCRDIEMKFTNSYGSMTVEYIGISPASFELTAQLDVPFSSYNQGCLIKGTLYILSNKGQICRIGRNRRLTTCPSITHLNNVYSVAAYREQLVVLEKPWKVCVLRTDGTLISNWRHDDTSELDNQLAVVGDKIVIPNKSKRNITVYSLEGKVMKAFSLPQMADSYTDTCAVEDSLIISFANSSQIFRISMVNNNVMWISTEVQEPQAVVQYKENYLIVSDRNNRLFVLDTLTGACIRNLENENKVKFDANSSNLCVDNDTLITYNKHKVSFYKLKGEVRA